MSKREINFILEEMWLSSEATISSCHLPTMRKGSPIDKVVLL